MLHGADDEEGGGWRKWLWMLACCIPMIVLFVFLAYGFWRS
jgi:hypothetical protein